jgi:hypothetical protein
MPCGSKVIHSGKCAHSEIPSETHLRKPQKTDTGTMLFGIFDKHLIPVWTESMIRPHIELPQGIQETMTSTIDRAAASRALAKAIAYHQAGKAAMAKEWAHRLVAMLRDAGIDVS